MNHSVIREQEANVAVLRLNRPKVLNALNVTLLSELVDHLRAVRDMHAVVLEGEGRAFCVGEDLKETLAPRSGTPDELRIALELLQDTSRLITAAPAVFIAAVQGYAIGGGAELALAADLVIAGPQARFRFPEVSLGHAVTGGITARLPAIVGLMRAKELLLRSRWVDAEEAQKLGLAAELAPDPSARARELARELAAMPRRSLAATKRAVELAAVPNQESALAAEVNAASYCFSSREAEESIAAFRERGLQ